MSGAAVSARLVRSGATAAVVLSLAAGAHLLGGGILPAPLIVAVLGSATLLAVTVLAKKALSLPALFLILGVGQWLLHHAFTLLSTTASCVAAPVRHYAVQSVTCLPHGAHAHASSHTDLGMLAAHATAVGVTGFMLHRGEAALKLAVAWLAPLLNLPDVVVLHPAPRIPPLPPAPQVGPARTFRDTPPLRGPPAGNCPVPSPA